MVIRTNLSARTATAYNTVNRGLASKSIEKISSGYRINRAADDAAGLGITEKMATQIREAEVVERNIQEGLSVTQTADGALQEVTNILQRVRELSVQASNGTFDSTNDRPALQKEIDSLFEEVSRITKTADYNNINLFDGEIRKIVTDTTIQIPPTIWGNLDFINETDFKNAVPAKAATTTLDLVGITQASDLLGKSFTFNDVNNRVANYYFCDDATVASAPAGYTLINIENDIATPGFAGVSSAFSLIGRLGHVNYNKYASVSVVDGTPMQAVFKHDLRELQVSLTNPPYNNVVVGGNGEWGNTASITTPPAGDTLLPIDSANNQFTWNNDKEATVSFPMTGSVAGGFSNLKENTLTIGNFEVNFGPGTNSGNNIYVPESACTTEDTIKAYLIGLGSVTSGDRTLEFAADGTDNIKFTLKDSTNSLKGTRMRVYEKTKELTPGSTVYEDPASKSNASLVNTVPGTNEKNAEYELTIPDLVHNSAFTFRDTDGRSFDFYIYDSDQTKVPGKTPSLNYYTFFDMKGKTKADLEAAIKAKMGSYLNVSSDGNKIKFTYPTNKKHTITIGGGGEEALYSVPGTWTQPVFSSYQYFTLDKRTLDIDFDTYFAGGTLDIEALAETGFKLNGTIYKFVTAASPAGSGQTAIDISSATTIDDIKTALARTGYDISNTGNKITLTDKNRPQTNVDTTSFVDGIEGVKPLFALTGGVSKLSGGTNTGSNEAVIDFSGIKTAEDIDSLRNKGFRLRCATCPGEFINVLFVGKSTPPTKVPEFFEKEEPAGSGNIVKIKNIIIRTDEVDDPTKFAAEIVRQATLVDPVTNEAALDHFTGMRIDPTDPSKLIAFDKRIGDLTDPNPPGAQQIGKIESGIEADFVVETSFYEEIIDSKIDIYVGSFEKHQYIDIPLKALGLEQLNLLNASVEDVPKANELLSRVTTAVNIISSARGDIGAAENRLEHCGTVVSNTKLNLIAASAQIKDLDMAKEMVTLTKHNIMSESSSAMLAQANTNQQSVLSLLK